MVETINKIEDGLKSKTKGHCLLYFSLLILRDFAFYSPEIAYKLEQLCSDYNGEYKDLITELCLSKVRMERKKLLHDVNALYDDIENIINQY